MVAAVLLFSIVIIQLPAAFGDEPPPLVRLASLVPLAVALAALLLWRRDWRMRPVHAVLFGTYLLLVTVAIMRAGQEGVLYSPELSLFRALEWLLVAALGLAAFVREPREHMRRRHLEALCWAPVVYVALNVALHLAGVGSSRGDFGYLPATLLGGLGLSGNRTVFPLSSGLNNFGAIAGIALASAMLLALRQRGRRRWVAGAGAAVSLYAILATDSRAALLFSVTAVMFVILAPRARARGIAGLAMLLPLLPLIVVGVLAAADSRFGALLSREGASAATGTSRSVVWGEVLSFLSNFRLEHLFGYGSHGQIASEVWLSYSPVFRGLDNPLSVSSHNLLLQSVLDTGYVGLLVVLSLFVVLIGRLAAQRALEPTALNAALLAAAICMLLIGVVEAVPIEAVAPESYTFWLLALTAALRASPSARGPATKPPARTPSSHVIPASAGNGFAPRRHDPIRIDTRR